MFFYKYQRKDVRTRRIPGGERECLLCEQHGTPAAVSGNEQRAVPYSHLSDQTQTHTHTHTHTLNGFSLASQTSIPPDFNS